MFTISIHVPLYIQILLTFFSFTDGCGNDEFKCYNPPPSFPKCVPGDNINDGTNDCGDCSDEAFAESCVPTGMLIIHVYTIFLYNCV